MNERQVLRLLNFLAWVAEQSKQGMKDMKGDRWWSGYHKGQLNLSGMIASMIQEIINDEEEDEL